VRTREVWTWSLGDGRNALYITGDLPECYKLASKAGLKQTGEYYHDRKIVAWQFVGSTEDVLRVIEDWKSSNAN
jgi:hypothetical protein